MSRIRSSSPLSAMSWEVASGPVGLPMRSPHFPNGAGKSTFFKMLTCEVPPTSGTIIFEGRDITGTSVTDVCQHGLTKSYQVNQLFNRLTVRQNLTIAALAELRGKFRLDMLKSLSQIRGLDEQVERTLD